MRTYIVIGLTALLAHHIAILGSLYTLPNRNPELPTRAIFVVNGNANTSSSGADEPDKLHSFHLMHRIIQQPEAYIIASDWAVAGCLAESLYRGIDESLYPGLGEENIIYLWNSYQKLRKEVSFYRFFTKQGGTLFWIILSNPALNKPFAERITRTQESFSKHEIQIAEYHGLSKFPDIKNTKTLVNFPHIVPVLNMLSIAKDTQLVWQIMGHGSPGDSPSVAKIPLDDFVAFVLQCQKSTNTRGMFVASCYFTGDNSTLIAQKLNQKGGVSFPIVSEGVHNVPVIMPPHENTFAFAAFAEESMQDAPRLKMLMQDTMFRGKRRSREGGPVFYRFNPRSSKWEDDTSPYELSESYPFILLPGAQRATPLFPAVTIDTTMSATRNADHAFILRFPKKVSPDVPASFRDTLYCLITTPYVPFPIDIREAQIERPRNIRIIPARPNTDTYAFAKVMLDDTKPAEALAPFYAYARPAHGKDDLHITFPTILMNEIETTSKQQYTKITLAPRNQGTEQQHAEKRLRLLSSLHSSHWPINIPLICVGRNEKGAPVQLFFDQKNALSPDDVASYRSLVATFDKRFDAVVQAWEKDETVQRALRAKRVVAEVVENAELKKSIDKQWTLPKELQ